MEIIQERLEREYNLDLITTAPSVVYIAHTKSGEVVRVDNPSKMPGPADLDYIEEPIMKVTIHVPSQYVGAVVALCEERRGIQQLDPLREPGSRRGDLRTAPRGGDPRLARQAQERFAWVCQHGLRTGWLSPAINW